MRFTLIFLLVLIAFVQPASAEAVGETFLDTIINTIQVFTGFVTNALDAIKNGFMNVVNAIKALIPSLSDIKDYIMGYIPDWAQSWDALKTKITNWLPDWSISWDALKTKITNWLPDWAISWDALKAKIDSYIDIPSLSEIWNYIKTKVDNAINTYIIDKVFEPMFSWVGYDWNYNNWIPWNLYYGIKAAVAHFVNSLPGISWLNANLAKLKALIG